MRFGGALLRRPGGERQPFQNRREVLGPDRVRGPELLRRDLPVGLGTPVLYGGSRGLGKGRAAELGQVDSRRAPPHRRGGLQRPRCEGAVYQGGIVQVQPSPAFGGRRSPHSGGSKTGGSAPSGCPSATSDAARAENPGKLSSGTPVSTYS